jgi:hypothetical protein
MSVVVMVLLWCGLGALARPAIPMFTALPLTTTRPHIPYLPIIVLIV